MNILILSCNTGEGHNAAGHAVEEAAISRGHNVHFVDAMMLKGKDTSRIVGGLYIGIVKHIPLLFGLLYKLGGLISNKYTKSPVYWANHFMADRFQNYIKENSIDAVVMPHLFPAETITYMKKHDMISIPAIAVGTDYTCIPFWEETNCDYYIIPDKDLIQEFSRKGVSSEKLLPYGIPVRKAFTEKMSKDAARAKCHLPVDKPMFLIMNGSMGFGKLIVFAKLFAKECKDNEQLVIICGTNKKIYNTLNKTFKGNKDVHIVGYTQNVSDYMDACDVIYTKPGGLTSTEALVKNIPIIHTAPIPGCETRNRDFFKDRGLSYTSRNILSQIKKGMKLAKSDSIKKEMGQRQQCAAKPDSADKIIDLLEELYGKETQGN